jgi:hypothetical protein
MILLKTIWAAWKIIARKIGDFQGRLLLSVLYFVLLGPFAFVVKTFCDPLRLRPAVVPDWLQRSTIEVDRLVHARRQS